MDKLPRMCSYDSNGPVIVPYLFAGAALVAVSLLVHAGIASLGIRPPRWRFVCLMCAMCVGAAGLLYFLTGFDTVRGRICGDAPVTGVMTWFTPPLPAK